MDSRTGAYDAVWHGLKHLLDDKYCWMTHPVYDHRLPPFVMPPDPRRDIDRAMAVEAIVEAHSRGVDPGEDWAAAKFKECGKTMMLNINALTAVMKDEKIHPEFKRPTRAEASEAVRRWKDVGAACGEAKLMMRRMF